MDVHDYYQTEPDLWCAMVTYGAHGDPWCAAQRKRDARTHIVRVTRAGRKVVERRAFSMSRRRVCRADGKFVKRKASLSSLRQVAEPKEK